MGAVALGLAAAPFLLGSYAIGTLSRVLVFALLAISVNLLTGLTGLPTLGQSAYFGVGAYTAAVVASARRRSPSPCAESATTSAA